MLLGQQLSYLLLQTPVLGGQLVNGGSILGLTAFDFGGSDLPERFIDSLLLLEFNCLLVDDGLVLGLDLAQVCLRRQLDGLDVASVLLDCNHQWLGGDVGIGAWDAVAAAASEGDGLRSILRTERQLLRRELLESRRVADCDGAGAGGRFLFFLGNCLHFELDRRL